MRRGYLGVGAYPSAQGALVASLEDGGPAASAGIIVGDIITEIDGVKVTGPDSLRSVLGDRPGKQVKVSIVRGGAQQQIDVTIGSKS